MDELRYYDVGCEPEPGLSRTTLWLRRRLRDLLLPASKRMVQLLLSLCQRLEVNEAAIRAVNDRCDDLFHRQLDLAGKYPATIAFGWDYVAMTRRLAVLEEHVEALLAERERLIAAAAPSAEDAPARRVEGVAAA